MDAVVLADIVEPLWISDELDDPRVSVELCDVTDPSTAGRLIDTEDISFFYLSAIMSGQGETDFDLCWAVNFEGMRHVLESLRALKGTPRVVFTSTMACFSGGADLVVADDLRAVPETTYVREFQLGASDNHLVVLSAHVPCVLA